MAKVVLPIHYPATPPKEEGKSFILTEAIHIIEVDVPGNNHCRILRRTSRNNSNHKSNISQHHMPGITSNANNYHNRHHTPSQISNIALKGLSQRSLIPSLEQYVKQHNLTQAGGYTLSALQNHYTPPSPTLESLFMEATSCRSSQPGIETLVSVYNFLRGHKHPNGLFPPYQLGVSGDEGVLSVYRSYKGEDLNFSPPSTVSGGRKGKGVWWSDIMFEVWKRHSTASTASTTPRCLRNKELAVTPQKLRFVAIPEVNNEQVKAVAEYAFQTMGLEKERDILVVDRDGSGGEGGWTLFDAFLGTASVKAINRMAIDHADELGHTLPSRVYVRYSRFEYPQIGEVLLPNLLVEMRKARVR
ncbi:hypothetical protein TWF481_003853 [Arthrobotrys musiformis]|uniref:Uncharacterized protein n=1 Tax=Arthrobotrys musiformis TaxID=47236 RepID=A0AAV9WIA5_9PEZI